MSTEWAEMTDKKVTNWHIIFETVLGEYKFTMIDDKRPDVVMKIYFDKDQWELFSETVNTIIGWYEDNRKLEGL